MCTVILLRRPGHDWPLVLGANRDEMLDRPWQPPARHWHDRPEVIAGRDELAGGTWMGLNDDGVVACILNRRGSLGPAPGKRSRGELVLEALDHADAADAAKALSELDPMAYRPFNIIVADNRDAVWLTSRASVPGAWVDSVRIPEGLHMLTAGDLDDRKDPRIARHLPLFLEAQPPDPESAQWSDWKNLLGTREAQGEAYDAMSFKLESGFGTSSSALLALPSAEAAHDRGKRPAWLFAAGPPESAPFQPVDISSP